MQKRHQTRLTKIERAIRVRAIDLALWPIEEFKQMTDAELEALRGHDLEMLSEDELKEILRDQAREVLAATPPTQAEINDSVWGKWGYTPQSFRAYFEGVLKDK